MIDDASQNPKPELSANIAPWFDAWKTCAQNVLSQISGQPQTFELSTVPFDEAESDLRYTVVAAGAVQGELVLRLHVAAGILLARKLLGEIASPADAAAAGAPSEASVQISKDDQEALEELLRQVAGLAATALGAIAGGAVQLQLSHTEGASTWVAEVAAVLRTRDEAGAEIAIAIGISPTLAVAFASRHAAAAPSTPEPVAASEAVVLSENPSGYRRLFDVGLGVKLRFGSRRMLLRDVLALSSGLVVELDNPLNSPVDLLLDGRIIARGEVVVIDGKYGLRVTNVADPSAAKPA